MQVLIVEHRQALGEIWRSHFIRHGIETTLVKDQAEAINSIRHLAIDLIVLDLDLPETGVFAIADFASYQRPDAKVIFVTDSSFFSDGSIFKHVSNACALLPLAVPPDDLCAMAEHYGSAR